MAKPTILVVDCDEGFGLMLTEGLENSGHYAARCVHTGADALQAVVETNYDLVVVDVALTDMAPATLIKAIRESKNGIKIMVIPLIGQSLPDSIKTLDINGVLTKPFFVGDLPDLMDQALGRRRSQAAPAAAPPPATMAGKPSNAKTVTALPTDNPAPVAEIVVEVEPAPPVAAVSSDTVRYLRANESEVLRLLDDLNREVRAEAILLIAGVELMAQAGMLAREQCQELAKLVAQSARAAAQAANFLGEPAGRFSQSLHEGEAYRLYSLSLGEGIVLSLALNSNVPLGMIRHQCRLIAEQLSRFI